MTLTGSVGQEFEMDGCSLFRDIWYFSWDNTE